MLATAIVLALLSGMVSIANATTNGQPDGDAHPYVALLIFGEETIAAPKTLMEEAMVSPLSPTATWGSWSWMSPSMWTSTLSCPKRVKWMS